MPTRKDAKEVARCLSKFFTGAEVKIIGSLATKEKSDHDIDVLVDMRDLIAHVFRIKKYQVEITDWGGYYCHDTPYGDVDLFFAHPETVEKLRESSDQYEG